MNVTPQRINFLEKGQSAIKALFGLGNYIHKASIDRRLQELISFRVSQLNGCAFCIDMHTKELRAMGETEQRLFGITCWRETPYYTDKERAALAWTEGVNGCDVPDELFALAKSFFSDLELIDITLLIATTNTWNRLNISFATTPGNYTVGQMG